MKLYSTNGAPNGRRTEAAIRHMGIAISIERIAPAQMREPEFLALNPNGMIPVLVDRDFVLWESNAILQYLAETTAHSLYPAAPQARAEVARWLLWEQAHFNKAFGALAFETAAKPVLNLGPADPTVVSHAQAELERFAPVLDGYVAERSHLVGDAMTLADYAVMTFEGYRDRVPFDWTRFANINRYFDGLRTIEHWRATDPRNAQRAA